MGSQVKGTRIPTRAEAPDTGPGAPPHVMLTWRRNPDILHYSLLHLGGVTSQTAGLYGGPCVALLNNSYGTGRLRSTIS